ncbi:hypothetical protein DSL64_08050 [Dyadobacter luteus]|uniref:histidine kinase n=1 Tax=Dyadobacter luteus TaxID=2259619 RepID=A0A3D8YEA8_9BACT|nr:PAS domain S-box protein [Dyadobacter luteus]REA62864.1 hypothetical protein DSL64_08050 [Dyadobacter luteus]
MAEFSGSRARQLFNGFSEMHSFCRSFDWSQTPLGSVSDWSTALQTIVQTVLDCPFPSIVLWGDELIQIYNDGYREIMGNKHPSGLGQPTRQCWPEAWHVNESIYQRVNAGESVTFSDALFKLNRSGLLEDAWFNVSYSPVTSQPGKIGGVLVIVFETTKLMLEKEKRLKIELQRNFILTLSDALRPLSDPQAIQFEAVSLLGKFLMANRAGYAETQPDIELVAVTRNYTDGVKSIQGIYSYSDFGTDLYHGLIQGKTIVRPDVKNDPLLTQSEKQAHLQLDLAATVNVPLVKDGNLVAILFVHFDQAKEFSEQEIALIEETAERTWSAVERAKATTELRVSEQQLRAIVEKTTTGFARAGLDGVLTFVNQRYCQMLGYSAEEIVGKNMQDFTHPEDQARNLELFQRLAKTGESFELEKRNIRKDGSVMWVHKSVSALYDENEQIDQLLATYTDITARKMAESALRESESLYRELTIQLEQRVQQRTFQLESTVADLQRSNANLQQFAYIASHDLQEPLRKIHQFGDLLLDAYANPEKDGKLYVDRMLSATRRMSILINDLLDFSRLGSVTEPTQTVDLNDLVREVLGTLEVAITEQQAQIHISDLPSVTGNASQLAQLFQNLISNALKFRSASEIPFIQIGAKRISPQQLPQRVNPVVRAQAYYQIDVSDNGIGFDEKYLDRIFQMFQRLHGKSEYQGTGIGLAICDKVASNHHGGISATSQHDAGSVFSLFLPDIELAQA